MQSDPTIPPGWTRSRATAGRSPARAAVDASLAPLTILLGAGWPVARAWIAGVPLNAAAIGPAVLALVGGLVVWLDVGRVASGFTAVVRWLAMRRARAVFALALATIAFGIVDMLVQQDFIWDESLVHASALRLARDGPTAFFAAYSEIPWLGQHHPPLVPILHASAMVLFGDDLIVLRSTSLPFAVFAVVATFLIGDRWFGRRVGLAGAILLLASPLFRRLSCAAMNDLPVTAAFVGAVLAGIALDGERRRTAALALGIALGLGLLCKYTMFLAAPVVVAQLWLRGRLRRSLGALNAAAAVAVACFGVWILVAWQNGLIAAQVAWLTEMSGVVVGRRGGTDYALDGLFTKLPSGIGIWILPILGLAASRSRRERTVGDRMALVWIALVVIPLLFTLPDNRYFLPAYPPLALVAARGLETVRPRRRRGVVLLIALVLCASALLHYAVVDLAHPAFLFGSDVY